MDWLTFLKIGHIIGTALGVGAATLAEIFFLQSKARQEKAEASTRLVKTTYLVLRVGILILVLSGFGYLLFYRLTGLTHLLYNPRLWAKLTLTLIIVLNALALQAKRLPYWTGGGISLVSWYGALVLGAWRGLKASYWEIMLVYIAVVVFVSFILRFVENRLEKISLKQTQALEK